MSNPPIITQRPPREKPKKWIDGTDHVGLLPGLGDIDWNAVSHAYGPAIDVPAQLLAVAQDGPLAREACDALFGSLCHSGTVYDATTPAVPFLAELACRPVRLRKTIVVLLGAIALGEPRGPAREAVIAAAPRVLAALATPSDVGLRGALVALAAIVGPAAAAQEATLRAIDSPPLLAAGARIALRRSGGGPLDDSLLGALAMADADLGEALRDLDPRDRDDDDVLDLLLDHLASLK